MNSTATATELFIGVFFLVGGTILGFSIYRWRERSRGAALELRQEAILESCRREGEAIAREARLKANEEALKLRTDTELAVAARHKEMAVIEQRLAEREDLVNRQLENLVRQEKSLRTEQEEIEKKSERV